MVALLGAIGPDEAAELVRVRSGPAADLAVLTDIGTWVEAEGARAFEIARRAAKEALDQPLAGGAVRVAGGA